MSLRRPLKAAAEAVLARGGPAALARRLHRRGVAILAYHDVMPRGTHPAGERSLHIDAATFARHLDALSRTHRIVALRSVLAGEEEPDDRPRAVITFDDAYLGAVTVGADELERRGLTGTVFVAPALLGGRTFWWDALADPATGALSAHVRRHALETLSGDTERILAWARETGRAVRECPALRSATTDEVRGAVEGGVLDVASHTWSHRNLAVLSHREVAEEIELARAWIRERFPGGAADLVAYPYGILPGDDASATAPRHLGFGLQGRLAIPGAHDVLPRINVPAGLSPKGLEVRAAGLWGS